MRLRAGQIYVYVSHFDGEKQYVKLLKSEYVSIMVVDNVDNNEMKQTARKQRMWRIDRWNNEKSKWYSELYPNYCSHRSSYYIRTLHEKLNKFESLIRFGK